MLALPARLARRARMTELKRVLIANRGEIALRVIRAAHDASMTAVAVYADEDAGALYVRAADDAVQLDGVVRLDGAVQPDGRGGARAYLDIPGLLAAADRTGADSVHPGYGFLAESAEFAREVTAAGLTWIGPPAEVIEALGDKIRAREIAARAGAPMVPGSAGPVADPAEAVDFATRHGLPIAIKAAYGGGGRARGAGRVRPRRVLRRGLRRARPARRGAGHRGHPRHGAGRRHPRLHPPAPLPEAGGRGAGAVPHRRAAGTA